MEEALTCGRRLTQRIQSPTSLCLDVGPGDLDVP